MREKHSDLEGPEHGKKSMERCVGRRHWKRDAQKSPRVWVLEGREVRWKEKGMRG